MAKVIDADFELVSGPLRIGDEHPFHKGWFLTDRTDWRGNPLWHKPPGPIGRWIRRICIAIWAGCILLGIAAVIVFEGF